MYSLLSRNDPHGSHATFPIVSAIRSGPLSMTPYLPARAQRPHDRSLQTSELQRMN